MWAMPNFLLLAAGAFVACQVAICLGFAWLWFKFCREEKRLATRQQILAEGRAVHSLEQDGCWNTKP